MLVKSSTIIFLFERKFFMKKLIVCFVLLATLLAACTAQTDDVNAGTQQTSGGNFTDEMKIPYAEGQDLDEYGADSVERQGDHQDSPYFSNLDFYNMESTDTLTILPQFKTQQQTSEWSCGISSVVMVLNYYDLRGDYNERTLAEMRSNGLEPEATTLKDIVAIMEEVTGRETESTYDYPGDEIYEFMTLDKIQEYLKNDQPVIIGWNDWGGHWQVIIGYDTMGTETQSDDVIIVADSYDTTDHNQDGYGVYPAERFYYNWTMYDFFTANYGVEERDMLFCVLK